jgi:hypothetical protein
MRRLLSIHSGNLIHDFLDPLIDSGFKRFPHHQEPLRCSQAFHCRYVACCNRA